ncbi:G5 domain-containing protein [Pectinatus sottacetonis]|uniref:G5 domain-containing protein n=1 Tax=Pectinatus sottacetonis TaxID=1002795 RepID=UPI0018C7D7F8|nr:G5 domain-containing protein [Pectinatus sottacetonis]
MTVKELLLHHTKFARVLLCTTLIFIMSVVVGFSRISKNVCIVVDGQTKMINTINNDPKDIIRQAGIKIGTADKYVISTKNIKDGTTITIHRAVPVMVQLNNNTQKIKTTAGNVENLLKNLGYNPLNFYTMPAGNAALSPNMLIRLEPLIDKIIFRESQEPFNTVYQNDDSLPKGETKVVQEGANGIARFMVKEYYKGGKKVDEEILQKSMIKNSVPKVIAKGTYSPQTVVNGEIIPAYSSTMYVEATAYLPTDGSGSGYTATGIEAHHGVVAVDPDVIPYGTRLYIPGYGEAVAADTGGFSGRRIDLCMDSYSEAMSWGRRNVKIYILQ